MVDLYEQGKEREREAGQRVIGRTSRYVEEEKKGEGREGEIEKKVVCRYLRAEIE